VTNFLLDLTSPPISCEQ